MKCRALYSEENHNIVFFKSKGLTLPSKFRIIHGDTKSIFTPEEGYSNDDIVVKYDEDTKNLLVSSETTQTIELAFYNELKKVYIPFSNSEISTLTFASTAPLSTDGSPISKVVTSSTTTLTILSFSATI